MTTRRAIPLSMFFALAGCTHYAVDRFQVYSGFEVAPLTSFVLCRGATHDLLECTPTVGTYPWEKVSNIPPVAVTSGDDNDLQAELADHYLGAAFGASVFNNSCMSEETPPREIFARLIQKYPVRTSSVAQLIEETVVTDAAIHFGGFVDVSGLADKTSVKATFELELRNSVQSNSSSSADIKWVSILLGTDMAQLTLIQETTQCRKFAKDRRGSLIVGIAGFVITANSSSGTYVSTDIFQAAARIALAGSAGGTLPNGVSEAALANAGARWSNSTNRKISTTIASNVAQSTFYPLWVQLARVGS